jgi:hypothetical protein
VSLGPPVKRPAGNAVTLPSCTLKNPSETETDPWLSDQSSVAVELEAPSRIRNDMA